MKDLDLICEEIKSVSFALKDSLLHDDINIPVVTSMVYVRMVEENLGVLDAKTYDKLQEYHNDLMRPYKIRYEDVVMRLIGEGYHFS